MIVAALDTATPSTVTGVLLGDGRLIERRDDPPPGTRPNHASRLLALAEDALETAGVTWDAVDRLAVGVGPGGFTGLRIGVATARALAQAHDTPIVPVSTLRALALGHDRPVVAAIDARRGEVFAAAWLADGAPALPPAAYRPDDLAARVAAAGLQTPLAVGDGTVRFRAELERAGATIPPDGSPAHRVTAAALCRLGAAGAPAARDRLVPDYRREPDAVPPSLP